MGISAFSSEGDPTDALGLQTHLGYLRWTSRGSTVRAMLCGCPWDERRAVGDTTKTVNLTLSCGQGPTAAPGTRARASLAVSTPSGHLGIIVGVVQWLPLGPDDVLQFCCYRKGHLGVHQWARCNGCPWGYIETSSGAALGGQLDDRGARGLMAAPGMRILLTVSMFLEFHATLTCCPMGFL